MFRLIFLVLFGSARSKFHPHESPKVMTIPLGILAIFAIFVGLPGSPFMHNAFQSFIHPGGPEAIDSVEPNYMVMGLSTFVAFLGIGIAYLFYILNNKILPLRIRNKFKLLHNLLYNKYYIDEIYDYLFIKPSIRLSRFAYKFDLGVIDGAVNACARAVVILSKIKFWIDHYIVDGAVNMVAWSVGSFSRSLRRAQTGYIQTYLLIAFFGLILIIVIKLM